MLKIPEMVQETTTTSGTGDYELVAGAVSTFRSFDDELNSFSPVYTLYCVFNTSTLDYEINLGTWTAGSPPTLTRGQLLKSSTGFAINWPGGSTQNVVAGLPGVMLEGAFDPSNPGVVRQVGGIFTTSPISSIGLTLISATDIPTVRTYLSLRPGTDVQAYSSHLSTIVNATKTANLVLQGSGGVYITAQLTASQISATTSSYLTGETVQAQLTQLVPSYAKYDKSTSQTITTTSEVSVTDLDNLAIPGGGNSAKIYRCSGQITVVSYYNTSHFSVAVKVGPLGTKDDPLVAVSYFEPKSNSSGALPAISIPIPGRTFTPASGDKVTITFKDLNFTSVLSTASGTSFVVIEQISNA